MPKALHITLNVIRGILVFVTLGAAANSVIDADSGAGDQLIYLNIAAGAGLASISLSPRLWTSAASAAPSQPPAAAPAQTHLAVPPQQPPSAQPQQPGAAPQQPHGQPGQSGQVYGGGTYQGQTYGQPQAAPADPNLQAPGGQSWQQRPPGVAQ